MPPAKLNQRPRQDRLSFGPGLSASQAEPHAVDRDGGQYRAGLISGVAVITRGEALGHGMWIDATTLQQVADGVNAKPTGVKSRFTHPSLSGDGMGKQLGRAMSATLNGDIVRADLHLTKTSHKTPDGDLAEHVMGLADETPEDFGNSIVFGHDIAAENAFVEANGGKVLDADYGYYDLSGFKSPDPANTQNLFHVRIAELRAVDVVDEPAANPSGLFARGQEIPTEADALCAYAFGLSDARPASAALGIDPDRLRGFASRFLSTRGLSLTAAQEGRMPDEKLSDAVAETAASDVVVDEPTAETPADDETVTEPAAEPAAVETEPSPGAEFRAELSRFMALDPVHGPKWFADGKTFSEAQGLLVEQLKTANADLTGKLSAMNRGEKTPVSFSAVADESSESPSLLPSGVARFAASIRLPGRN